MILDDKPVRGGVTREHRDELVGRAASRDGREVSRDSRDSSRDGREQSSVAERPRLRGQLVDDVDAEDHDETHDDGTSARQQRRR